MGARRKAREIALQVLYAYEINKIPVQEILHNFREAKRIGEEDNKLATVPVKEEDNSFEIKPFTKKLIDKVIDNHDEIDNILEQVIKNWSLSRLAMVDKSILRLAAAEIKYFDDIPPKVSINEYIEIAKSFGDEDSPSFVNGVLDKIVHILGDDLDKKADPLKKETK